MAETSANPLRVLFVGSNVEWRDRFSSAFERAYAEAELVFADDVGAAKKALAVASHQCVVVDADLQYAADLTLVSSAGNAMAVPAVALLSASTPDAHQVWDLGFSDYLLDSEFDPRRVGRCLHHAIGYSQIGSQLADAQAQAQAASHLDPLTRVLSRTGLEYMLRHQMRDIKRNDESLTLVLIDIERFGEINERFGYGVGDGVLLCVAHLLEEAVRDVDCVARLAGGQFIVALPNTKSGGALEVVRRVRERLAVTDFGFVGAPFKVQVCFGVASIPRYLEGDADLISWSRAALLRGRALGSGGVGLVLNGEGQEPDGESAAILEAVLSGAELLRPAAQKLFDVTTGECVGYEFLSRGPVGPLARPDVLFRVATEQQLLTSLDMHCLRRCVAAASRIEAEGIRFVNLFPSTLRTGRPAELLELFEGAGGPARFCLELSEQEIIGDPLVLKEPLDVLRASGVRFALDDVGFGRSSVESLVLLEPEFVKIDRKWVDGVAREPSKQRALARVVHIAKALGAFCVAEGVETEADFEVVRALGVDLAQGYLWDRPKLV